MPAAEPDDRPVAPRPVGIRSARVHRRARWGALALALAFEALLGVIDASVSNEVVLTSAFVLAPFALAIAGRWRQVAIVGAAAVALAVASGWWNDYAGSSDHLMRIAIVVLGSVLATLGARARQRARSL